ncbi:MAG: protein translocase subunit SecF [Candidatus Cloacimonetes bacterium]|nr:protein translocase subunit SecF [Candidatus Cloacimonadota bacterium]
MRFFANTKIDFIGRRNLAFILSGLLILAGIISLIINKGPVYSIDFTGGVALEVDLTPAKENARVLAIQEVRDALSEEGYGNVEIQEIKGRDQKNLVLIKTKTTSEGGEKLGDSILNALKKRFPNNIDEANFLRLQDEVGPRIGGELREKAVLAIFWALLGIILYIWWRFEFSFGLAAVAALFHDVIITIGIFSLTGREIGLPVVAALLTIVGYSLNDTIVVFDRIREDLKIYRKESYSSVINHSINETLSRTIITSLTTFLVVLSLFLFGGSVIHDFAFALLIGVVVGTYSSIFIASPILVEHFINKQKRMGTSRKK